MPGTKNNRRVQMTKLIIQSSLIELLKKKLLSAITVTELCKLADVNRATFYAHYQDIPDCMRAMEQETTQKLLTIINRRTSPDSLKNVLTSILEVVKKRSAVALFVLTDDPKFLTEFLTNAKSEILKNDQEIQDYDFKNKAEEHYMFEYCLNGIIGSVRYWLKTGLKESPEELASYIYKWGYGRNGLHFSSKN
ncbi:TetR/AcrR family transcriptional regulator [Liquorilactobacillus oeni]|uniref:Transcription regulator n=1 Tax=Liquorilactobacillus oeni DSM 19972 TaxID=1423777 RepID=A0A0R1M8G1_9LACO|nr:TetR-like C-terminal domain-containing protein [Liquorilactobacillus oeni]KRL04447.1 transcription regulator [Liquorilactobacillus oeni DSM 19972]